MYEFIFVVVTLGLMALAWWWLKRRRAELVGTFGGREDCEQPAQPQALTRDALVNRQRDFDPSGWDDSPDPAAAPAPKASRPAASRPAPAPAAPPADEDAAPVYFDRDFLERRQRERDTAPGPDAPPAP